DNQIVDEDLQEAY
ncbi:unnamed protein product, partial [Rotaria magnacalcarata]